VLVTFLGVRGSTPAPGPEFVQFGGHTSCVAVSTEIGRAPSLVLDAGTGLRTLSPMLNGEPFRGSILLSHLHWDHMQGIPFFTAGDRDDAVVEVLIPAQDGRTGKELVGQAMGPPAFPIPPDGLKGSWQFATVEPGVRAIEGLQVSIEEVSHKGGRTYGFRVSDGTVDIAYIPDHIARAAKGPELEKLVSDVDLLIHDAQFVDEERALADAYGHSTVKDCVDIATRYRAKSLIWFHHGPQRTDSQLLAMEQDSDVTWPVRMAREGESIDVAAFAAGSEVVYTEPEA
jgi:phosphoribosyl 1,2-cyclic phosphodiesterase